MSLYKLHLHRLLAKLEKEKEEAIQKIKDGCLPLAAKERWILDMTQTYLRDRTELELEAIRFDLKASNDPKMMMAEINWAEADMKSDRCPEFLRDLFEKHVFEMSAMNFQTEVDQRTFDTPGTTPTALSQSPT